MDISSPNKYKKIESGRIEVPKYEGKKPMDSDFIPWTTRNSLLLRSARFILNMKDSTNEEFQNHLEKIKELSESILDLTEKLKSNPNEAIKEFFNLENSDVEGGVRDFNNADIINDIPEGPTKKSIVKFVLQQTELNTQLKRRIDIAKQNTLLFEYKSKVKAELKELIKQFDQSIADSRQKLGGGYQAYVKKYETDYRRNMTKLISESTSNFTKCLDNLNNFGLDVLSEIQNSRQNILNESAKVVGEESESGWKRVGWERNEFEDLISSNLASFTSYEPNVNQIDFAKETANLYTNLFAKKTLNDIQNVKDSTIEEHLQNIVNESGSDFLFQVLIDGDTGKDLPALSKIILGNGYNQSFALFNQEQKQKILSKFIQGGHNYFHQFSPLIDYMNDIEPNQAIPELKKALNHGLTNNIDIFNKLPTKIKNTAISGFKDRIFSKLNPDDQRNAFTGNKFDRLTLFMKGPFKTQFPNTENEVYLETLTEYVENFGLNRNEQLIKMFLSIKGLIKNTGETQEYAVNSVQELKDQMTQAAKIFENPQTADTTKLSESEIFFLKNVLMFDVHKHGGAGVSFEKMVQRESQYPDHEISSKFDGFQCEISTKLEAPSNIPADNESFNSISNDFVEILNTDKSILTENILKTLKAALEEKLGTIGKIDLIGKNEKQIGIIQQQTADNKATIQSVLNELNQIKDIDNLLKLALNLNTKLIDINIVKTVTRQVLLSKVLNNETHFDATRRNQLNKSIENRDLGSAQSILEIVNDIIKDHVWGSEAKKYWTDDFLIFLKTYQKKQTKNQLPTKKINQIFPEVNDLGKLFDKIEDGSETEDKEDEAKSTIKFSSVSDLALGDAAAYVANACYSKESTDKPVMVKYPNMTPIYIFDESNLPIGSVLLFDLETKEGKQATLVRAFNIPEEVNYDIEIIIDKFLENLAVECEPKGIQQIIIPESTGAISNYNKAIKHLQGKTVEENRVSLNSKFAFNGYDLTDKVFVIKNLESSQKDVNSDSMTQTQAET